MNNRLFSYLLLLIATGIWGIGGPIVKYSFQFITPNEFLFWRYILASIICLPILIWYIKKNPIAKSDYLKLIILGLLGGSINLALGFAGLNLTTIVEASIISSLTPMFVALAGAYFLHERLTKRKEIGIVLAISGTVVAILNPLLDHGVSRGNILGNVLLLASGLTWVLFVLFSKRWSKSSIKPFHIISFSAFVSIPFFYILTISQYQSFTISFPNVSALPAIIYMAIFATLIAYTAYETAVGKIDISEADIFSYLTPIWSIPIALYWLGEKFDPALIVSLILIACGIAIAEYRPGLSKEIRGHHHAQRG